MHDTIKETILSFEDGRSMKGNIYKAPLSLKMQRTTARAQLAGPVKVFTREEIEEYERRNRRA